MAERRMFNQKITESDAFLDLPASSQALYFHLNMNADDDGFVNAPKRIQRAAGASDDDLKLLLAKSFIIAFESGVIVIKHWKMHNVLKSDRYKPTEYIDEKSQLNLKENKIYSLSQGTPLVTENPTEPTWNQNGSKMVPNGFQNGSVGKDSIGKVSIDKDKNAQRAKKTAFNSFHQRQYSAETIARLENK